MFVGGNCVFAFVSVSTVATVVEKVAEVPFNVIHFFRPIDDTKELDPDRNADLTPDWTPDKLVDRCTQCHAYFSFRKRQHHCRNCGLIYCQDCSSHAVPIPDIGYSQAVRVCTKCYTHLEGGGKGGTKQEGAIGVSEEDSSGLKSLPACVYPRSEGKPKTIHVQVLGGLDLIAADRNGKSDPYVELSLVHPDGTKSKVKKTATIEKTLAPEWEDAHFAFSFTDAPLTSLKVVCKDYDFGSRDDFLGERLIKLDAFENGTWTERWYGLHGVAHGAIHLRLRVSDPEAETLGEAALTLLNADPEYGAAETKATTGIMAIPKGDWKVMSRDPKSKDPVSYALDMSVIGLRKEEDGWGRNQLILFNVTFIAGDSAGRHLPFVAHRAFGRMHEFNPSQLPHDLKATYEDLFPHAGLFKQPTPGSKIQPESST